MTDLTVEQVIAATGCPAAHVGINWPPLLAGLHAATLGTRNSQVGLAATVAVETGKFRPKVENLNYSAEGLRQTWPSRFTSDELAEDYARQPEKIANYVYAGRMGNGDTASGDGWRYRGRGLGQHTGRDQYAELSGVCGVDLLVNPDLLLVPEIAAKAMIHVWRKKRMAAFCEVGDWEGSRRTWNGALTGYSDYIAIVRRFGVAA